MNKRVGSILEGLNHNIQESSYHDEINQFLSEIADSCEDLNMRINHFDASDFLPEDEAKARTYLKSFKKRFEKASDEIIMKLSALTREDE